MMDRRLLYLIRLFGLTAEGTLVHEGDLLCEEFQLNIRCHVLLNSYKRTNPNFIGKNKNCKCFAVMV